MPENNSPINYTVKRSARAKNMRLTVKDNGEVFLTLPRFVPEFLGKIFVQKNIGWIKKKQSSMHKNRVPVKSSYLEDFQLGTELVIFDQKKYSIKVFKTSKKRNFYILNNDELELYLSKNTKLGRIGLVENFYKDFARDYLTERSEYFALKLGAKFNQIRIKNTKTRWGSCSSKKNLNYNWRIILAPEKVVDYLVVHEVCHLKEMNHSQKFWDLVEGLDPDFKSHKKWLRENQQRLLGFLS